MATESKKLQTTLAQFDRLPSESKPVTVTIAKPWRLASDTSSLPVDTRVVLLHEEGEVSVGWLECDPDFPDDYAKDRFVSGEIGLSTIVGWLSLDCLPASQ